ncbi:MAG: sodium/glutamate symporter [Synergistaceae bacterium]|jgi:ESS family glutamate:Na+ symporter|nr:sodium/glutamate symporter [Synergistaceae bacterium]
MGWETVGGVFKMSLDPLFTTALTAILFVVGVLSRRHIKFLTRFCIPAPVIGGLFMSLVTLGLHHHGGVSISFTTALQTPMMLAFFTTVGIGGSLSLLKSGGRALFFYLVICWALAAFQNAFGAGLAQALGIHPVLGVMAGAVSLEGGHGAAAAFGPTAEALGVAGAQVVAIASATYGLIAGGLLGGPIAGWLINRDNLELKASQDKIYKEKRDAGKELALTDSFDLFRTLMLVLVFMALGSIVSNWVNAQSKTAWGFKNFSLPGYVGAMFIAVIFRNLNDAFKLVRIHEKAVDVISDVSLGIFLTMAMMSLRIWELYDLAIPLIVILLLQTAALAIIGVFILFPLLGKDYDAAVMCSGFLGHGLGATPNAVSNMNAVCERCGVVSYKAFLIVPLCGAVLIDLVGIPSIVWFINYFTQ